MRRLVTGGLVLLLTGALAACGSSQEAVAPTSAETSGSAETAAEAEAAAGAEPAPGEVSVTDATGTAIALPAPPERIVCLDGTCADVLAELGVLPVAAQSTAIVTDEAFFGPEGGSVSPIGGSFSEPNLEDIAAAEPDLVMGGAGVHGELRDALEPIAPLYLQANRTVDAAVENLRTVGELLGRQEEAEAAVARFEAVREAYASAPGERVPLSMYGGSGTSLGIEAADSLFGQWISEFTAYPWPEAGEGAGGFLEYNLEEVLARDPDAIYVLTFDFEGGAPPFSEQLAGDPLWGQLRAVREGRVYEVDRDWWGTGYGTRSLTLILHQVMPTLYPEEFPEPVDVAA
jgi:iron complex transport system substrate-binding protein